MLNLSKYKRKLFMAMIVIQTIDYFVHIYVHVTNTKYLHALFGMGIIFANSDDSNFLLKQLDSSAIEPQARPVKK